MNADVVVDIGNTRIKWGRCQAGRVVEAVSLPHDDAEAWQRAADEWQLPASASWVVASVVPASLEVLRRWCEERGGRVVTLSVEHVPLRVALARPDHIGIDRLLNAVAALELRQPGRPAVIVGVGSAVTVDLVTTEGEFVGGAILPGPRLMAQSLYDYTALLPLLSPEDVRRDAEVWPGVSTPAAMACGIAAAVRGAVELLCRQVPNAERFLTGGDADLLTDDFRREPFLTLEGVRCCAGNL